MSQITWYKPNGKTMVVNDTPANAETLKADGWTDKAPVAPKVAKPQGKSKK